MSDSDHRNPALGSLWASVRGREVLRIERVWVYPWSDIGPVLTVRGHPIKGGRPLICPVDYLRANYRETTPEALP